MYSKIQRAIEASRSKEYSRSCITIMIDDLSVLEIAACGSIDCVLDFLYYCVSLTSELVRKMTSSLSLLLPIITPLIAFLFIFSTGLLSSDSEP